MSENSRVKRWREAKQQRGLQAVTIWLTSEEELRLKDLALQWHCSPSAVMQQALAEVGRSMPQDIGRDTDTLPIRQIMQEELAAMQGTLPALVHQLVREELAALPVVQAPVSVGITVDPTDTQSQPQASAHSFDVTEAGFPGENVK
jgi:hypothetical protein